MPPFRSGPLACLAVAALLVGASACSGDDQTGAPGAVESVETKKPTTSRADTETTLPSAAVGLDPDDGHGPADDGHGPADDGDGPGPDDGHGPDDDQAEAEPVGEVRIHEAPWAETAASIRDGDE